MGKKDRISAAAATAAENARMSRLKQNLKTVNNSLVMAAAEYRKQIEKLRLELASMAAEKDFSHGIERDVFALVISSSLRESTARRNAELAAASETARNLMRKAESVAADVNAMEMRVLSLLREKDERKKELKVLKERITSKEDEERGKQWRKWLLPAAAVSVALLCYITKG